jgi:hypothetical protein
MKKETIKVYIQRAQFTSLGYMVETEEQRQITARIAAGEVTTTDSPETQWELHTFLNLYLFDHATPIDMVGLPQHHSGSIVYQTKSGGLIHLDNTMGWSSITCNKKGALYLENLLREKKYSVMTTKDAITG